MVAGNNSKLLKGKRAGLSFDPAQAKRRLRTWMGVVFVFIALPVGFVLQRTYAQLGHEALYQYRLSSEQVVAQLNQRIFEMLNPEEDRPFEDYRFFKVATGTRLEPSPLAGIGAQPDRLPGLQGYFEIEPDGRFTSPLLPEGTLSPAELATLGLNPAELVRRKESQAKLERLLATLRPAALQSAADKDGQGMRLGTMSAEGARANSRDSGALAKGSGVSAFQTDSAQAPGALKADAARSENALSANAAQAPPSADAYPATKDAALQSASAVVAERPILPLSANKASQQLEQRVPRKSVVNYLEGVKGEGQSGIGDVALSEPAPVAREEAATLDTENAEPEARQDRMKAKKALSYGVSSGMSVAKSLPRTAEGATGSFARSKSEGSLGSLSKKSSSNRPVEAQNSATATQLRVTRFEAEIDPFQVLPLPGGYFAFFRKVWRQEHKFIQGFVVSERDLLGALVDASFYTSALSTEAGLRFLDGPQTLVTYPAVAGSSGVVGYGSAQTGGASQVISRARLAPPFSDLELEFSVPGIRSAPGQAVLGLLAAIIALVLVGGFGGVYRLAVGQIEMAVERNDFVSAVSHELRTPLTSIRMYAEMLKSGIGTDPAKQISYLDYILSESERLSRLISNVLQLARISRGVPAGEAREIRASEWIELVRGKVASQVEQAGFGLEIKVSPDVGTLAVRAEEDRFTQIFINLVDNALKFSPASAKKVVELGVRKIPGRESWVAFTVRDFGPGVPKDQVKKIFQLFYRAENELTRKTSGTGIGLALVRELADSLGAEVDLANLDPGAEFRLAMRCSAPKG